MFFRLIIFFSLSSISIVKLKPSDTLKDKKEIKKKTNELEKTENSIAFRISQYVIHAHNHIS